MRRRKSNISALAASEKSTQDLDMVSEAEPEILILIRKAPKFRKTRFFCP